MKFLLTGIFCLVVCSSFAQHFSKRGYITRKLSRGETFASIAAKYNLTPRQLANFNNLDYYAGPLRSKKIKIPIQRKSDKSAGEVLNRKLKEQITPVSNPAAVQTDTASIEITTPVTETIEQAKPDSSATIIDTSESAGMPEKIDTLVLADTPVAVAKNPVLLKEKSTSPTLKELAPLLIFLTASIILLVAAIFFYRAVKK